MTNALIQTLTPNRPPRPARKRSGLKAHPLAKLLPMISLAEYDELKEDIRINGQREPITLYGGAILDGRSRYRACCELGITPKTVVFNQAPQDALAFVRSKALKLQITDSQKACVTVKAIAAVNETLFGIPNHFSSRDYQAAWGLSADAPDLFEKAFRGYAPLKQFVALARRRKQRVTLTSRQHARLTAATSAYEPSPESIAAAAAAIKAARETMERRTA